GRVPACAAVQRATHPCRVQSGSRHPTAEVVDGAFEQHVVLPQRVVGVEQQHRTRTQHAILQLMTVDRPAHPAMRTSISATPFRVECAIVRRSGWVLGALVLAAVTVLVAVFVFTGPDPDSPVDPPGPPGTGPLTVVSLGDSTLSGEDRKSTRLNSSYVKISYAVFCLKKKKYSKIKSCLYKTRCRFRECVIR